MDGRHVGNYFLCEQIKIDGERVDIRDCYEDVKNDIAVAGRLGIAATTLDGVLAVKGHGGPGHAGH